MDQIFLDYNSTTPVDPEVLNVMLPYFSENFGNAASRTHSYGWFANESVEMAREEVASLLGADPREIIFTSGATESINLVLKGIFESNLRKGNHLITCRTEHKAVLDTCNYLETKGAEITYLNVDREGIIDLEELEDSVNDRTILLCFMTANNETGVIQPIGQISEIAKSKGVLFFTDATQAAGKIPIEYGFQGPDFACISAHKFYGPKGCGALFIRKKTGGNQLQTQIHGGGHEWGLRSGTLNVPGIVGIGKAAKLAKDRIWEDSGRISKLRTGFEQALEEKFGARINGSVKNRLPNTSNLCFPGKRSGDLISKVHKMAVAAGSACTSAKAEPSHVLRAMGLPIDEINASIRFSLGRNTTPEELNIILESFKSLEHL